MHSVQLRSCHSHPADAKRKTLDTLRLIAGLVAAGLTCAGGAIYVRAIWRKTSTTRWASWLIWTVTSVTSLATYYNSGARESALVIVGYTFVCASALFAALWRRNEGGGLTAIEILCLAGAGAAGLVWWLSGSAVHGQVASVIIEVIAYIPIWRAAAGENRTAWSLEASGSVCNLLAISSFTFALSLYPVAILTCNMLVVALILRSARTPRHPEAFALAAQ
jgi:hypothetical protein